MVWACKEKGRKLHKKKNDENRNTREEDKREAAEAVEWQYKGGYEKGGCQWRGGGGPGEVENGDALLRPLEGKAKKKKKELKCQSIVNGHNT